ncbi:aarf domain containing kinase 2 [Perkinsela sp. CCAP 1560/4]|nr:aarf domain containing kinase 2 [Perkinsela sp. CCAP 1560/4]|eukprot:KNH07111.1 aarf domain containing kinase 2 [Perkinsela sp. CCAP 1560/4]
MNASTCCQRVSEGFAKLKPEYLSRLPSFETRSSPLYCAFSGDKIVRKILQSTEHTAHQAMIELLVYLGILSSSTDLGEEALFIPSSSTILGKPTSFFDTENPEWTSQRAHWQFRYEVTSTRRPVQDINEIPIVYTALCIIGQQKYFGKESLTRERARRSAIAKALSSVQKQLRREPSLSCLRHTFIERKVKSARRLENHMQLHILSTSQNLYLTQSNALSSSRFQMSKKLALADYLRSMKVVDKVSFDVWEVNDASQQDEGGTRRQIETKHKALCYAVGRTFIGQPKNSVKEATESAAENATALLRSVIEFPFASIQYLKLARFLDRCTSESILRPVILGLQPNKTVFLDFGDRSLKYTAKHDFFTATCALGGVICLGISARSYGSALEMAVTAALRHLLKNPMAKSGLI